MFAQPKKEIRKIGPSETTLFCSTCGNGRLVKTTALKTDAIELLCLHCGMKKIFLRGGE